MAYINQVHAIRLIQDIYFYISTAISKIKDQLKKFTSNSPKIRRKKKKNNFRDAFSLNIKDCSKNLSGKL